MNQGNLLDWTPHELQHGKQFEIGDEVMGPTVMSHPLIQGLTRGPSITGTIQEVGWKYLRTSEGDIWRDAARYTERSPQPNSKQLSIFDKEN